jgi:3-methyladenine DNA glycosylase AlkD
MNNILAQIKADLKKNADEKTRQGAQRYFKEQAKFYGVKTISLEKSLRNIGHRLNL